MHQAVYSRCLICARSWESFVTPKDQKTYYRCSWCGYIYLSPDFHPSPAEERSRYLKHNNSLDNTGYVTHLNNIIEEWILPLKNSVTRILDYGSGPTPVFAGLLEKKGFLVSLYDLFFAPHEENLEKSYEMVTLIEVIEHVCDPAAVLTKLSTLIPPGGKIMAATRLYTAKTDFSSWWYRMDQTHRGFFSKKTIEFIAASLSFSDFSVSNDRIIVLTK